MATVAYVKWTCKDGRVLRIVDMEDQHLFNTIRMLERNAEKGYREQDPGAVDILEMCIMPYDCFLHPCYEHLVREANKRGIEL